MDPVKKYLGFFFWSTEYVQNVKEKMDQLNLTEQDTRRKWEQAVARTHEGHQPLPLYDTQHNFFESRKSVFDEALKALQSNNESQKMIALSGMGGVGKTTMMEQLKKEVEASKLFDRVVKVVLGESMSDIISLQRAIARYIDGEDIREETIDARADRLHGDDPTLQKIGEDIVRKCRGLPIAIVTIAKSLSGNIEEAWKKALRRLKEDDLEDLEGVSHRIFEMSYENLKKDQDKAIFILSGIFPDDFNIRIEDLFRFGWGLGFFKDANTLATARNDMKICVNNLIRANLLIESDIKGCVKMHDLVRSFVLDRITKVKQASIMNYSNTSKTICKGVL
ncbi:hypothetical protein SSX86_015829 [Deinandra increscens subsp. villosa]|uniref:NB-ARC domain-containing protein n=1 Tax=Deinandra increscens subsp. villosa TaxID=3103831 RepID=A0AAP0D1L3_9ASTR